MRRYECVESSAIELTVVDVVDHVDILRAIGEDQLCRIVGPRAELEKAQLIVERKPERSNGDDDECRSRR